MTSNITGLKWWILGTASFVIIVPIIFIYLMFAMVAGGNGPTW